MLPCDKVRAKLGRYRDRELSSAESREMAAHLEACQACRLEFGAMEALDAALNAEPVPPVPEGLVESIMLAARRQQPDGGSLFVFPRFWRGWSVPMRFATACTAVAACYLGLVAGAGSAPSPRAAAESAAWLSASSAGPIAEICMRGAR